MRFALFNDWSELAKSADKLFTEAEKDSVFFSRAWFESLTPHLINPKQSLLLACVINNNIVQAILPLLTNENREWNSLSHPYSALFTILLDDDQQSKILKCLCQGLKSLDFDYLTLAPVSSEDEKLNKFRQAMQDTGLCCYTNHKAHNWFYPVSHNQNFTDYMKARPSRVRNTVLRKQRKLDREHDYQIQLYINEDIEQALEEYHEIYKASWKANEQQEDLVKDLINQFTKRAWPRLAILSVNDQPIAAQLWFVVENKASIFRLVYDEQWKDYSPGSILMCYLLEHVIDKDKVKEIDFLSGNDAYKKDWMSQRRERIALICTKKKNEEVKDKRSIWKSLSAFLIK